MTKKKAAPPSGYVRKENMILAICIAFALGFFGGIVLTVYKSGPPGTIPAPGTAQAPSPSGSGNPQMVAALEADVKRDPNNVGAWIQLGNIHFDNNRYQASIDAYEKALVIDPNNANVLTDLGVMYRRNKQPREAIKRFDMAMQVDPKHEVCRFNKGIVLLHDLNDFEGAIQSWEALVAVNPLAMAPNGQSVSEMIKSFKNKKG